MKMKLKSLTFAALIASSGLVYALDGSVGAVKDRQLLMDGMGGAMKALSDMVKSGTVDAGAAKTALEVIQASAANIPVVFETNDLTPPTKALPDIWANFDAFKAEAGELQAAAEAALAGPADAAALGTALGAMGAVCQDCHKTFRMAN
jgi:cytochrome c556